MVLLKTWFTNPQVLTLFMILPFLAGVSAFAWRRRRQALALLGQGFAHSLLPSGQWTRRFLRSTCLFLGLTLMILGSAGPRWGKNREEATAPGRDLVVVLDMSRSMLAQDVLGQSAPNRLGGARDALVNLIQTMARRGGHRLGLVVFAARARVVCPLTHDYDQVKDILEQLDPEDSRIGPDPDGSTPPSDTRIGLGLKQGVEVQDSRFHGHQDILLISDGDDPAHDGEWETGITAGRAQGIPIYTVGVGDPVKGSRIPIKDGFLRHNGQEVWTRLQEEPLEQIARQTGGSYIPAHTKALPLGEFFDQTIAPKAGREDKDPFVQLQLRYRWFFGAALVLLTAELILVDRNPVDPKAKAARNGRNENAAATRLGEEVA